MNAREFFDLVARMRAAQRRYFETRDVAALRMSKGLEQRVDAEISRVRDILDGRTLPGLEGLGTEGK